VSGGECGCDAPPPGCAAVCRCGDHAPARHPTSAAPVERAVVAAHTALLRYQSATNAGTMTRRKGMKSSEAGKPQPSHSSRTDTLRSVDLVARERQHVDVHVVNRDGQLRATTFHTAVRGAHSGTTNNELQYLARHLSAVCVEEHLLLSTQSTNLRQRLHAPQRHTTTRHDNYNTRPMRSTREYSAPEQRRSRC
jgi:hypothetical protein